MKAKLTLKDRIYACDVCGHTENRDVNAARNLLSLAASGAESLNACGGCVRPGLGRATAAEPGTRHRTCGQDRDRRREIGDCGKDALDPVTATFPATSVPER